MKLKIRKALMRAVKKYMKNTISAATDKKVYAIIHHGHEDTKVISDTTEIVVDKESVISDMPKKPDVEEVQCSGHDHMSFEALNQVFNLPVDTVFQYVFTECEFSKRFNEARRAPECKLTPWPEESEADGNKIRHINYDVTVTYSLGTKVSKSQEKQVLYSQSKPGHIYVVDTEVTNSGIPYTDTFYVANRICITRVTSQKSRLRVTSEIKYKKHVWGVIKNFIEKNTYVAIADCYKLLGGMLQDEEPTRLNSGTSERRSKVIRRRRTRTGNATDMKKPESPESVEATTADQAAPIFTKSTADILVRVIYVILVILVLFNGLLFYKLWSLETKASTMQRYQETILPDMTNVPTTDAGWVKLLERQHSRQGTEIGKWKKIISSTVSLVRQIETTLVDLDRSIEVRSDEFMETINYAAEKLAMDHKAYQAEFPNK